MKMRMEKQWKKAAAVLLSAAMAFSNLPVFGGTLSFASELESNTDLMAGKTNAGMSEHKYGTNGARTYGNSSSTGYVFNTSAGDSTSISQNPQSTFDFAALPSVPSQADEANEGYSKGYDAGLMSSYRFGYWNTLYAFSTDGSKATGTDVRPHLTGGTQLSGNATDADIQATRLSSGHKNGEVVKAQTGNNSVEVRPEIKVSRDGRYLIVQYTVFNPNDREEDFWIGNEADTMIYNHDGCPTVVTPSTGSGNKNEGLHLIAHDGGTYNLTSLDIQTYNNDKGVDAGMQTRDGSDPSCVQVWSGYWRTTPRSGTGVTHNHWVFAKSDETYKSDGVDAAAAAFSAYFNLKAHETKTARFAIAMRVSTYYVDPDAATDGDGFISTPCKSIASAIAKIKASNAKKAYIYLMKDVDLNSTITIPSGVDITISTTDFTWDGTQPQAYDKSSGNRTVNRASGFNDAMFKIASGSSANTALTFSSVTVDGGSSSTSTGPILDAETGSFKTEVGGILQNNYINADAANSNTDMASAVQIGSGASVSMNNGTITGNRAIQGSAVNCLGNSGTFKVENTVRITGNTASMGTADTADDTNADVYLATGRTIAVDTGTLDDTSSIGVNVQNPPTTDTAERVVATTTQGTLPYSAANFFADKSGNWTQMASDQKSVALKATIFTMTVNYVSAIDGVTTVHAASSEQKSAGSAIDMTPAQESGWVYDSAVVSGAGLTADANGRIQGTMPNSDVVVTYRYNLNQAVYRFDSAGGLVVDDMTEATGNSSSLTMPQAVRTGYNLAGWYKYTDANGNNKYDAGESEDTAASTAFPSPVRAGVIHYVAKWTPGSGTFNVLVTYKNNNTNLPITFKTRTDTYHVEETATASPVTIPGYKLLSAADNPAVGTFDAGKNYSATMAAQGIRVDYIYNVDPAQTFTYEVIHKTSGGNVLSDVTMQRRAEQIISAAPISQYGIEYAGSEITAGASDNAGAYVVGAETLHGAFDASHNFTGYMPNQKVTVTYTYNSTAQYFVNSRFMDADDNDRVMKVSAEGKAAEDAVTESVPSIYGYLYQSAAADPAGAGTFDANGTFTGTMPSGNLKLDYKMHRDPAFWKTITFETAASPYNNGIIGSPASSSFLKDDGTDAATGNAYTFAKMKELGLVPSPTGNPSPYYRFAGWYKDAACTTAVEDTDTFSGDVTVYAKFEEDPAYWLDVTFVAGAHGTLTGATSLHAMNNRTWSGIASQIPSANPEINYIFVNWTLNGTAVQGTDVLTNGAVYTANFSEDPNVWNGTFEPVGTLSGDGRGEVKVYGTKPDDVYIVTDLTGKIVATLPADSATTTFEGLYPGTRYNVYEGSPDTIATAGEDISTATGTSISAPQEVLTPVVQGNYSFNYDPKDDSKVDMVINPADPDSDYALIDENGKVVSQTGSTDGWMTPVGTNPATVTFTGLDPNATYTVVARKKGDSAVTVLSKAPDGNQVVANPGDDFEVPKFIVETKNGTIHTVGTTSVEAESYDQAVEKDQVTAHADATNAEGQAFKYWKVINGHCTGITGRVTSQDVTFTMDASNVVLSAVYEKDRTASPSTADVEEEIRGAKQGDYALDPADISNLEQELTTDQDRTLMSVNGADVTYRIVFNRRDSSSAETALVKPDSISGTEHPSAFCDAWSLDIIAERYLNGRKVGRATDSDATTGVIVQLDAEDTDMMDYQMFDVTSGQAVEETVSQDPEQTAGLFTFTGTVGHTYVLVYSKAYKLHFTDNNPVRNYLHLNDTSCNFLYSFKVRKGEAPTDSYYTGDYERVTSYADGSTANALVTPFEDIYGVQYDYQNWSRKSAALSVFDPDAAVKKMMILYAYYTNNRPAVEKARVDLTDKIAEAKEVAKNPYLKQSDVDLLVNEIAGAQAVLDKVYPTDPRAANYAELQRAFDDLKALLDRLKNKISQRSSGIESSGGGSTGSGGRGIGTELRPYEQSVEKAFTLGVDGYWQQRDNGTWSFVLNGGLALNTKWGKIQYSDPDTGRLMTKWYYFNGQSEMVTGWYHDEALDRWYYMNPAEGTDNGQMVIGWIFLNGQWYYLDPVMGEMYVGWHMVGDRWYYFTPSAVAGRPEGSLYMDTTTPDGYRVNSNGEWEQ